MNRKLFLSQLRIQLRGISASEIEEIMNDYERYFDEAEASRITEEQAAENLGNPREIAQDLIKQSNKQRENTNGQSRNVIVIIGLLFFNIVFVLGLLVGAAGLFFGLIVAVIAFILSPLFALISLVYQDGHLFELFVSFILLGIGLLAYPQLIKLGKLGYEQLQIYINWNKRMMKGAA